ncbi:MAG: alpha/beta fold hydrolase [Haloferacaceae archaeon]
MPTVPIEGGTLRYRERGEGPPLVWLHGGWQSADSWGPQVARFADEYRVVTFDLRGHGRTGGTDQRTYSVDLFTDDLETLLAHLGVDRPILGGISLGGMVVQSYLDRHPDAARGAVVGGPVQSVPPVDLPPLVKSALSPVPYVSWLLSTVGPAATFRSLLGSVRATTGRPWLTVDAAVRERAMEALDAVSASEFRKIFRALYTFVPPDLSHVRTPTLVLYGDHEAPPVKRQGEHLAETVARGSWREIPGAGHLVNQDDPEAFNAACAAHFAEAI